MDKRVRFPLSALRAAHPVARRGIRTTGMKRAFMGCSPVTFLYKDKHPVMVDGERPQTFQSQAALRRAYEDSLTCAEFNSGDALIYPGAPCGFNPVKPFLLAHGTAENILLSGGERNSMVSVLLSGGERNSMVSVLLSVLESYGRDGAEEIDALVSVGLA